MTCAHVCVIYNTMQSNQCLACNFVAESYALISRAHHDVQQRDKSNILCLCLCRRTLLLYCDGGKCGMGAGANDDLCPCPCPSPCCGAHPHGATPLFPGSYVTCVLPSRCTPSRAPFPFGREQASRTQVTLADCWRHKR